nr:cobalt ECF transporter T component CbiQ [Corynebacterium mendelii]
MEQAAATSRLARVNVGQKALLFLGLLLLAVSLPPWPALPMIAVVIIASAIYARVPWRLYLGLVGAPTSFLLPGMVPLIWSIGADGISLIDGGTSDAARVLCRCVTAMSATMLFAVTTPMSEQLAWLARIGVPDWAVQITMLTYRMIGTLIDTARTMYHAQAQRLGYSNWRCWISSLAGQASSLFVVAFTRARTLQEGMELRADISAAATGTTLHTVRQANARATALIVLVLLAVTAVSLSGMIPAPKL